MWGIVVSALARFFSWVLGAGTVKWAFAAGLWFGLALLLDLLLDLLPAWFSPEGLSGATCAFTPEVWFFLDYFQVSQGLSMVLSAHAVRFLIRRIPFIG
jgi:hypothetical protein